MATTQIRIMRDNGSTLTSTRTIADADITRMVNVAASKLGKTQQQALDYIHDRVLAQAVAFTRNAEATQGEPIPIT